MSGRGGHVTKVGAACAGLAVFVAQSAGAQDQGAAGFSLGLSLSEQILHEDDDTSLRTDLGLTLDRQTRSQAFRFSASTGLEKSLSGGVDGDFEDPRLSLGYSIETRDVLLALNAAYRRSELDTLARVDEVGENPLSIGAGQRENSSVNLDLEIGREAPFGATLALGYRETDYIDTGTATLLDQTRHDAALTLRFDLSRTATATLRLSQSDLNREGGVDVKTERITAGFDVAINPALTATASIGDTRITQTGTTARTTRNGNAYSLGLVADRPNGSWRGSVNSDVSENGRRSSLRVSRQIELPRGSLTLGGGISRNDDTNSNDPTYSLNYVQALPRGEMRVGFNQSFSTDSVGAETLDSRLNLSLQQELTPLSSLSAGLSYRDFDRLATGGIDTSQLDLSLDYAYTISNDWAVFAGISHSRREQDGAARRTEETVFVGLRTSWKWRR